MALLTAERDAGSDALDDAVAVFLALALADVGREREALALALGALAPHLPRYQRSAANYARELTGYAAGRPRPRRGSAGRRYFSSTTIVLMVAVTSSATSTTTMRVPTVRIGSSRWTLRRSMRMPRASRIASTMSCDVTEPNRRPSSPAWCVIVSTVLLSSSALSRAFVVASASALLGGLLAALRGGDRALGGGLGQLARDQVVAQVALGDVDDRAALAQRLVVLEQDRLGHGAA